MRHHAQRHPKPQTESSTPGAYRLSRSFFGRRSGAAPSVGRWTTRKEQRDKVSTSSVRKPSTRLPPPEPSNPPPAFGHVGGLSDINTIRQDEEDAEFLAGFVTYVANRREKSRRQRLADPPSPSSSFPHLPQASASEGRSGNRKPKRQPYLSP